MNEKILVYGQRPPPYHGCNIMTDFFLRSLKKLGYKFKLSSKTFSRDISEVNKINVLKFLRYFPNLFRFLRNLLTYSPVLVVFFISVTRIGLLGEGVFILLTQLLGKKYILYLQGRGYQELCMDSPIFCRYLTLIFSRAKGCIILGESLVESIEGFSRGEIYVIPNCVEDTRKNKNAMQQKGEDSNALKILFLANLTASKGVWTLLKAIPEVISELKDIRFIIAGPWQDEELENSVMKFISDNSIEDFVQFPGPFYGEEKEKIFERSDLFVFPTNYPLETFGLVNLEAMRASLPVISTDIGTIPEVVVDGKTGFIIQPEDVDGLAKKIIYLAKHAEIRRKMGKTGRKRFEVYYTFETYTKNVCMVMRKILARGR